MSPADIEHARRLVGSSKTAALSTLAPRDDASLLYADAGGSAADPLAGARVTLLGDVTVVHETEVASAREKYLA